METYMAMQKRMSRDLMIVADFITRSTELAVAGCKDIRGAPALRARGANGERRGRGREQPQPDCKAKETMMAASSRLAQVPPRPATSAQCGACHKEWLTAAEHDGMQVEPQLVDAPKPR